MEMNTLLASERRPAGTKEKKKSNKLANLFVDESYDERASSAEDGEERLRWDNFIEYFLSIIGFVIDLGNVWR